MNTVIDLTQPIYENDYIRIEVEDSEIPWLKIFAQQPCKEMSQCCSTTKRQIWQLLDLIEQEMLDYFKPEKINIASFANYLPQVHWHIMARYKKDSFFPEPIWGEKQRNGTAEFESLEGFLTLLLPQISLKIAKNRQ